MQILLLLLPVAGFGQAFENIRVSQQDKKIIVVYDLVAPIASQAFSVRLFASHNNFEAPITRLTGDIGDNVKPGNGKKIEWDALGEIPEFKGNIVFELRGTPGAIGLSVKSIPNNVRRGKPARIEWVGGAKNESIKIEVHRNGKLVSDLWDQKNSGSTTWEVPAKAEKGAGYTIKVKSDGSEATSQSFSVKPKFPFWLKAVPVIITGVVVAIILREPPPEEMPLAPDPN